MKTKSQTLQLHRQPMSTPYRDAPFASARSGLSLDSHAACAITRGSCGPAKILVVPAAKRMVTATEFKDREELAASEHGGERDALSIELTQTSE